MARGSNDNIINNTLLPSVHDVTPSGFRRCRWNGFRAWLKTAGGVVLFVQGWLGGRLGTSFTMRYRYRDNAKGEMTSTLTYCTGASNRGYDTNLTVPCFWIATTALGSPTLVRNSKERNQLEHATLSHFIA